MAEMLRRHLDTHESWIREHVECTLPCEESYAGPLLVQWMVIQEWGDAICIPVTNMMMLQVEAFKSGHRITQLECDAMSELWGAVVRTTRLRCFLALKLSLSHDLEDGKASKFKQIADEAEELMDPEDMMKELQAHVSD